MLIYYFIIFNTLSIGSKFVIQINDAKINNENHLVMNSIAFYTLPLNYSKAYNASSLLNSYPSINYSTYYISF